MNYPAFEAKEITGEALLKDRSLMELWKWASDEGQVQAVSVEGKNYAVVKDDDLVTRIRSIAPGIKEYRYDEASGTLI